MIGLTCLTNNGKPLVPPKLNQRRAVFVLSKIDEILAWEKATDRERDSKFVELGRYLCEVRRDCTGEWTMCIRSMSSWRGSSLNPDAKRIT